MTQIFNIILFISLACAFVISVGRWPGTSAPQSKPKPS